MSEIHSIVEVEVEGDHGLRVTFDDREVRDVRLEHARRESPSLRRTSARSRGAFTSTLTPSTSRPENALCPAATTLGKSAG
jgi:hypothetical protein